MLGALAFVATLVQGLGLTASAGADRDRVGVGEEFTFTVLATSSGTGNVTLIAPAFSGFEIVSRSERREVGLNGARSQVWEFTLRAKVVGHYTLGPVQVVQGGIIAQAPAVDVEVLTEGIGISADLNPRLRALLLTAVSPGDSGAAVTVLRSTDHALVGQQVDIVTLAWFPRDLRLRLRRQPTLEPPSFTGVWSYPQPVPAGIAETKRVGDTWYDLFIHHQVIFPITPGPIDGTPAVLRYSVPLAFQFFSQEERFELHSDATGFVAVALPDSGRPAGFDGAVGSGLVLTREVEGTPRAGEPVGVRFLLSGRGNVALWPPPFLRWPNGLQVYPEGTDEKLNAVAGVLGGTKIFRYLVVPDSAGALPIPTVTYQYFDPVAGSYQTTSVAGLRLPVAAALTTVASRAEPPPLLLDPNGPEVWRLGHAIPWWGWIGIWLLLPAVFGISRLPRIRRISAKHATRRPLWLEAQHRLDQALDGVLHGGNTDPTDLSRALREAGADGALADRIVRIRERLGAERFARSGGAASTALLQEVGSIATTLEALARRGPGRAGRMVIVAALLFCGTRMDAEQVPAERLYETGASRAAMEAFATRAAAAPEVVANWYGFGAAAYRIGNDGVAAAAWTRASRLSPRSRTLARAMLLLPAPDPASAQWRRVLPFTGDEAFLVATVLWLTAWGGVFVSRKWRGRWVVVASGAVVALAIAGYAAKVGHQPLGLLSTSVPLRVSPNGRAPGGRELPVGTALRPERHRGGWVLVVAATGEVGWVEEGQVAWVQE